MVRTRNAAKRQNVAAVESALFNPDVVFLITALLDARDLCQVTLTCQAMGGKQAAYNGLSLAEESARQLFECASVWERSCLLKYGEEGWIELYHHLLMLRSKLTFDQLVGSNIQYGDKGQSSVRASNNSIESSSALCSNHVMRSGRHFSVFTHARDAYVGIVRPVQINRSDFVEDALYNFHPGSSIYWEYLIGKQTERWGASNVHCCALFTSGCFWWFDWTINKPSRMIAGFQRNTPIGLLLDLGGGALTVYQNGQRLATLKDGLSGEYCWYGEVFDHASLSIERGSAPGER